MRDLTGQTFHRVTVLGFAGYDRRTRSPLWLCRCRCGTQFVAYGRNLVSGNTKSCGCLRREVLAARNRARRRKTDAADST